MNRRPEYKIPYIKIGENASISFKDNPPDKFTVLDILLDDKGNYQYSDKGITNIPIKLENGKGSFEIKKHMASALDSYQSTWKTDIRGFRIIASWGESECEYAFLIRTDAF